MMQRFIPMLFILACSRYATPELPDLDKKSFSTEEILEKQKKIRERVAAIS
jgi:hypothetical protein